MRNLYIFPYKMGSKSASALAKYLYIPQIRHEFSKFIGSPNKLVINWGSGELPKHLNRCRIINRPDRVRVAANKLSLFRSMAQKEGVRFVPWTTSIEEASKWLKEGNTVVARQSLTGHSGHGIVIVEPGQKLPQFPLYTKYMPKDSEWRIHIINNQIIFRQRKIKDPTIAEPKTWKIRSHDNGFIFQHNDLSVPKDVETQALAVMAGSGLDFGAVDVICTKKGVAYVLEINTACGLEGETISVYGEAFKRLIK